jgi:hypothetical protein
MTRTPVPEFRSGDVILFASKGDLPGWLSRWSARSFGEGPTYAVHTAQFLDANTIIEMGYVTKVRRASQILNAGRGFEVWRCSRLTDRQREALALKARAYVGTKFGWAKLFTHVLDDLLNKVIHKEVFLFRRLNHSDRYPICSWITAFSYDRALHYRFGAPPDCADPDQIHDWVKSHHGEWAMVYRHESSSQRLASRREPRRAVVEIPRCVDKHTQMV